jgi:outer membrane protein assembly factor BamA
MNLRNSRVFSLFLTLFLVGFAHVLSSQTWLVVDAISVSGNKKTKDRIILRELTIEPGDSITLIELNPVLEANRLRLMNLGLFAEVLMNVKTWDTATNRVGISVEVQEAWYVYPIPTFELADRNFNVWWVDYEHSLRRVNYGFNLYYSNFTGHLDYLKVKTQFGFTRKFEVDYTYPYINRAQTLGLSGGFLHTRNKAINYATFEDKQQFFGPFDEGPDLLRRTRARLGLLYRPGLQFFHFLEFSFNRHVIDSTISNTLNPDFFLSGSQQRFFSVQYDMTIDRRDVIAYPTRGYFAGVNIRKDGLRIWDDLDQLFLTAVFRPYFSLSENWSLGLIAQGRVAANRSQQPFYNSRALGYEEGYVRGYEFYVIDGLDYGLFKTDVRWNFVDREINWGRLMPLQALQQMSLKIYLDVFADVGYANNPFYADGNPLANTMLYGYGVGLDFLVYFNKLVQVQVSRNRLGELGVYLTWELSL